MLKRTSCIIAITVTIAFFLFGCGGSDNPTSSSGSTSASFRSYEQYVRDIAPPEYTSPSLAPGAYGDWTTGEYPLLSKVFSEDEPMSLYSNTETLDNLIEELNYHVGKNEDGEFEPLEGKDSSMTLTKLTSNLPIPATLQSLFQASSVDLDYLIELEYDDNPQEEVKIGFTQSGGTEELLLYHKTLFGSKTTSHLFYAFVDTTTDSIMIIGAVCDVQTSNPSVVTGKWSYRITKIGESDFDYQMAWSDDEIDFMGRIIGGGNKDVEFALRYQGFDPSTAVEPHEDMSQLFGPNYADEGTLTTGYDYYISTERFLSLSDIPTSLIEVSF